MYLAAEFLIGMLLDVIKRCDLVVQSPKNQASSVSQYILIYGVRTLVQLAFGVGIFVGVLDNKWVLGKIWTPLMEIHFNAGTSFVAGILFHNGLDWLMERSDTAQRLLKGKPNCPDGQP